jgi:hypothetical protein
VRYRPLPSALSALTAFAAACSDAGSPTAPAAATPSAAPSASLTGGTGESRPLASLNAGGMCLDVTGAGTSPGTQLILYQCHGGANQQFSWQANGELRVYGSMCLDAGQGQNWSRVAIQPCDGGAAQRWRATAASEVRGLNDRCLDLDGNGRANYTAVQTYDCHGGANQRWDNGASGAPVPAPPPAAAPTSDGIPVYPGESIQAKVNAAGPGAAFLLKAGVHARQTVVPKTGMAFYGEPGAVMDGQGATAYAFSKGGAPYPSDVRIQGITIQNYAPAAQLGPVLAGGHSAAENTTGWVVEGCEIRNNSTGGVRVGHATRLIRNHIHHNGQIGVVGIGDDILLDGNEIAYNNTRAFDAGWEGGGTKFVYTNRLTARGNFVHHNDGPGLWTDGDNVNTLYENNRSEDNAANGIFHEIGYAAVIRNNTVARNGFTRGGWLYGAGIMVSSSRDVEIYGNTVTNNANGITAVQQNRGSGALGAHVTQNVYVHDNVITMATGRTGVGQDVGDGSVFTSRNNRFANNTYRLGLGSRYFEWADGQRTEGEWRGYGLDVNGTFTR